MRANAANVRVEVCPAPAGSERTVQAFCAMVNVAALSLNETAPPSLAKWSVPPFRVTFEASRRRLPLLAAALFSRRKVAP
ncbi:MAG: hypothetical protein BWX70_02503 [Verrucomicrobia bacterium ADurb.Bin070]|nr:MAG: hypothetical protein BWX70_02503 [Verrucomicrobia bacterium ADurb.Bin070]